MGPFYILKGRKLINANELSVILFYGQFLPYGLVCYGHYFLFCVIVMAVEIGKIMV